MCPDLASRGHLTGPGSTVGGPRRGQGWTHEGNTAVAERPPHSRGSGRNTPGPPFLTPSSLSPGQGRSGEDWRAIRQMALAIV